MLAFDTVLNSPKRGLTASLGFLFGNRGERQEWRGCQDNGHFRSWVAVRFGQGRQWQRPHVHGFGHRALFTILRCRLSAGAWPAVRLLLSFRSFRCWGRLSLGVLVEGTCCAPAQRREPVQRGKRPRFPGVCAGNARLLTRCDQGRAPQWATSGFKAIMRDCVVSYGQPSSSRLATLIPTPRLLSRFLDSMVQHVFGMPQCPTVRQQAFEELPTRIHRELKDHATQVRPRLEPMTLRPRDNRAQDGRTRARLVVPQEQPVLATDGLVSQPTLRHVVVNRQLAVLRVSAQRLPLVQCDVTACEAPIWARAATRADLIPAKTVQDRHGLRLTQPAVRIVIQRPCSVLDVVQSPDHLENQRCFRRRR